MVTTDNAIAQLNNNSSQSTIEDLHYITSVCLSVWPSVHLSYYHQSVGQSVC